MKKLTLHHQKVILVCTGSSCCAKRAKKLRADLRKAAKKRGLDVVVAETSCLKACENGPHVLIGSKGKACSRAKPKDAADIVERILPKPKGK